MKALYCKSDCRVFDCKNLLTRSVSGVILVLAMVLSINLSVLTFAVMMFLISYGMLFEWFRMCKKLGKDAILGFVFITIAIISLIGIRAMTGAEEVFLYFVILWSMDSFAMVGGKFIQGRLLSPNISPNKTWSGLITGILGALFIASCFDFIVDIQGIIDYDIWQFNLFVILMCVLMQGGDLLESYFKRKHGIKDSGSIIPGHGGVLDRFDGILISAPVAFFLLSI